MYPDLGYQALYSMTCFTGLFTCIDPHTWPGLHPHRLQKRVRPIILMSAAPDRVTHHSIVPCWHPSHWIKTCLETRLSRLLVHRQPQSPNTRLNAALVPTKRKKKLFYTSLHRCFFPPVLMYASFVGHYVWRRVGKFQRFGSFQQNSLQLVVMAVTWASGS